MMGRQVLLALSCLVALVGGGCQPADTSGPATGWVRAAAQGDRPGTGLVDIASSDHGLVAVGGSISALNSDETEWSTSPVAWMSSDGREWTAATHIETRAANASVALVLESDERFLMAGTTWDDSEDYPTLAIWRSADGTQWTLSDVPSELGEWSDLAGEAHEPLAKWQFHGENYLAVDGAGSTQVWRLNGELIIAGVELLPDFRAQHAAASADGVVVIGHRAGRPLDPLIYVFDDVGWHSIVPSFATDLYDVTTGGDGFYLVTQDGAEGSIWLSPNGLDWVSAGKSPSGITGIAFTGSGLIAYGYRSTLSPLARPVLTMYVSSDGRDWLPADDLLGDLDPAKDAFGPVALAGTRLVAVGSHTPTSGFDATGAAWYLDLPDSR